MANYRSTSDLKKAVLSKCGEVTDGTSDYDADALTYLNNLYRSILSGGNEFNVSLSEPWSWAISRRPIVLTLLPAITGTTTVTMGSLNVTFASAPVDAFGNSVSVKGWHLKLDSRDEYFIVQSHVAGATAAQIDVPYTEASGAIGSNLYKLDYDVVDDTVVVDSGNQKIDFQEAAGALVATLTLGIYSASAFATHVAAQLTSASGLLTYTGSWDSVQRLFTFSTTASFSLLNASGTNAKVSASGLLGLDQLDFTGASSYTSSYPLNAINRFSAPMQLYRHNSTQFLSSQDQGKVYEIDYDTFIRRYPLTQMVRAIPDRFCVTRLQSNGIATVRFASYVDQPTKVEAFVIPMHRDLQDNTVSVPLLPHQFREALVFGASYYMSLDKSDNRADAHASDCRSKLQALIHHNRKELGLAGNNYAKLIPRPGGVRRKFVTEIT